MANKRVSELAPIVASQLRYEDLLLLSDVSAHESKKLALSDLSSFLLLDGNLTGSLYGTASYARQALSASYAPCISASYAKTSSWAYNISTASYAMAALSASYSLSSSYCITASYALTSSVELVYSSAFSDYAKTASYLLYVPGSTNGTASYALTASYFGGTPQVSASYALTSSWAWNAITASVALTSSLADTASYTLSASYLNFNGIVNGTASYALAAAGVAGVRTDYGIFESITQSVLSSQLDMVTITPALGGLKMTSFEAYGTIMVPFTSSAAPTDGDIELFVVDRNSGTSQSLDASVIYVGIGGSSTISGTLKYPFTLRGQSPLYGLFQVYVTASNGVFIEQTRRVQFKITSESEMVSVLSAEPMIFSTYPDTALLYYTASGVNFSGSASQVVGSGVENVTELFIPSTEGVHLLYYTWTLTGLTTKLIANNSPGITNIAGVPCGVVTMSFANCSLYQIPSLANTAVKYLDCSNNNIVGELILAPTMSYINCSNNVNLSLPPTMPYGLNTLIGDYLYVGYTPYSLPDTLVSMSFNNCSYLTSWLSPSFPSSLTYLDINYSSLTILPSIMPTPLLYVNVANSNINPGTVGNIAAGLVANGLSNGIFNFVNTPASESAPFITSNVTTLRSLGWTIVS